MQELLAAIELIKTNHKLNDGQFAETIGLDAGGWSRIKNGKDEPGAKFLAGLVAAFGAEIEPAVIAYLRNRQPVKKE